MNNQKPTSESSTIQTDGWHKGFWVEIVASDGVQRIHLFPNGYGASVITHRFRGARITGVWDFAVLARVGRCGWSAPVYDAPIDCDLIGGLTEAEVVERLAEVESLPPRTWDTAQ